MNGLIFKIQASLVTWATLIEWPLDQSNPLNSGKGQKHMMRMKRPNMKKAFAILTFISLALAASLAYGLMSGRPASAKSASSPSNVSAAPAAISSAATAAAQTTATGVVVPQTPIYAMDTDNNVFVLWQGATSFVR